LGWTLSLMGTAFTMKSWDSRNSPEGLANSSRKSSMMRVADTSVLGLLAITVTFAISNI